MAASKPRRVGQDFTRAGTLFDRWDGSKARAAMKCSLPGLDEIVSMKWRASKPRRVGLHDMVVIERPDVLLALRMGFTP